MTNTGPAPATNQRPKETAKLEVEGMRVLLVCHAEGMQDRYSDLGARNGGLTALGWEQSDALADWLRIHSALDAVIADSLLQSRLTAQRIGQAATLPISVYRDLPTFPAGTIPALVEGATSSRQLVAIHELPAKTGDGNREQTDATAQEAYAVYMGEMVAALDRLFAEHWGKSIALVSSRNVIAALLHYVLGVKAPAHVLELSHTGVSEIGFYGDGWRVHYVNRLEHLPASVSTARTARDVPEETAQALENLTTIIRVYNRVARAVNQEKREADIARVQHLLNFAKLPADQQVLDIGTGLGVLPLVLAEEGAHTVVGIDVSPGMLEQAEYHRLRNGAKAGERVSYRLAAAQALPFHDERFDVVIARLVLNHAQKPEQIVKEIVRVLKPGGVFILADLLSVDNAVKRATQNAIEEKRNPAHAAARSAEQYAKILEEAGLSIEVQEAVSFERELEEWLSAYDVDKSERAIVREMIEAGIETDAAGMAARRQNERIVFSQRMCYMRAVKPLPEPA